MAVTFLEDAEISAGGSAVASFAIPVPNISTVLATGDILIADWSYDISTTTPPTRTLPSGWTTITGVQVAGASSTVVAHEAAYHIVTAGEAGTSPTWTVTFTSGSYRTNCAVSRFSGVNTTTPFALASPFYAITDANTGTTTKSVPSVTTTAANAMLVTGVGIRNGSGALTSQPSGYTLGGNAFLGDGRSVALAHVIQPSAGASGGTPTWTHAVTAVGMAWHTALNPGSTDSTAPTVPSSVTATADSPTQVTIGWTASTDAVGVSSYRIRRGGVDLTGATAVTGTSFADATASPSTAYSYTVSAVDAAGNRSAESSAANVTTPAGSSGGSITWIRSNRSSQAYTTTQNKTSHTATYTTAPASGNLLILQVEVDKASGTFTVPAGWTALQNSSQTSISQFVAWRVATGGESAPVVTWPTAQRCVVAAIHEYSGQASSGPIGSSIAWTYDDADQANSVTIDPPAAASDGSAIALLGIDSVETLDHSGFQPTASGWTRRDAFQDTGSLNSPGLAVLDRAVTAGENLAAQTFSWTTADQHQAFVVLVNAAVPVFAGTLLSRVVDVPTSTAAAVTVRTSGVSSVRLKVGTNSAVTAGVVFGSSETPSDQGTSNPTITELTTGTKYYYRVEMTGTNGAIGFDSGAVGEFYTAPSGPSNFAFTFGSCTNSTDSASMTAIAARDDALFFHLGDLYYNDPASNAIANFRTEMAAKVAVTNHAAVFSTTPTIYTPSDHDGMQDDSTAGADATAWTNWNTAYREHFGLTGIPATTGVYRTFSWGRVRFIVLDTRSFCSNPSATDNSFKSRLGATQKQWLKDTITAASEPVIIIVQDTVWNGTADPTSDDWLGFTTERTELAAFFAAATTKKIGMLGGDAHMLAADDGTNMAGGIFMFAAAPFNNSASQKGGTFTTGKYPSSGTSTVQQYGRVVVADDGADITLTFTGYSSDNTARVGPLTVTQSAAATGGRVVQRWTGSALVTLRIDKWNGSALVQQTVTDALGVGAGSGSAIGAAQIDSATIGAGINTVGTAHADSATAS